jgi:uncharacterized membrane protein YozB (DUF420 family)
MQFVVPLLGALSVHQLPDINAALNSIATLLLLLGWVAIRRGRVNLHRRCMLAAFVVSIAFLVCYLAYHAQAGSVRFTDPSPVRYAYYTMLISHILLAITVPPLAIWAIYLGLRDRREAHRRVVRWAWPIWLYVSVTGVLIYLSLYHFWPSSDLQAIIR